MSSRPSASPSTPSPPPAASPSLTPATSTLGTAPVTPAPLAPHLRFIGGLRNLLAGERSRSLSGARVDGWASIQTHATDTALAPGLALVDLALDAAPPSLAAPGSIDLTRLPGRPIYRPLLAYALARCNLLVGSGRELALSLCTASSATGVWWALTAAALGQPVTTFDDLLRGQRTNGEFFDASPYDSPDLHWYDELVVLHAVTTYAHVTSRPEFLPAVDRASRFHTEETQPDHATSQPWAVHAFARSDQTLPLAELLLHGALSQNVGRLDVIGRILIADAVICLRA